MKAEIKYLSEYISKGIYKVLRINLTKDTCEIISPETAGETVFCFSDHIRSYLEEVVHYDDREAFAENMNMDFLRTVFQNKEAKWALRYRRKEGNAYRWTIARMFYYEAEDAADQILLLYVRDDNVADQNGLNADMKRQFQLLTALSDIYYTMYIIHLKSDSIYEIRTAPNVTAYISDNDGARRQSMEAFTNLVVSSQVERVRNFVDLDTISERMGDRKMITEEFIGKTMGWFRVQFIVVSYDEMGKIDQLICTTQIVEEEKRREEALRKMSTTDELTRLFNRRAYEEDMTQYKEAKERDDLVYISVDLNALKEVNDTRGHDAGDEIIIGAADCLRDAIGERGKVYRIGGDEFAVVMHLSKEELADVLNDLMLHVAEWRGLMSKDLTISMGYAFWGDHPTMTFKELANFADTMMYKDKAEYYARTGRNRRNR